jgi:hypothetical protein
MALRVSPLHDGTFRAGRNIPGRKVHTGPEGTYRILRYWMVPNPTVLDGTGGLNYLLQVPGIASASSVSW